MLPSPLTALLLLFYLLLVAAAVTGWFALTLRSRLERGSRERAAAEEPADELAPRPSNDEIRGFNARAERVARPAADDEDPFDRFLRSKSDELKL